MNRPVLIVEDHPDLAELEELLVRLSQGEPTVVRDGAAALAALQLEPYALVLLDLNLPRVDGQTVLDQLVADPNLCHVPVIVVSGEPERLRRTPQVSAVIAKPFTPVALTREVRRALERVPSPGPGPGGVEGGQRRAA